MTTATAPACVVPVNDVGAHEELWERAWEARRAGSPSNALSRRSTA